MADHDLTGQQHILALCGGVGGAKLALGLARTLAADQLTVVANTADDFEHLGLPISPDLDTVMYTLAGLNDPARGWGLAAESWQALGMLERYGAATWFQLGDRDIATHLLRRQQRDAGHNLSRVTAHLCHRLGVEQRLLPMSDDRVQTLVETDEGELPFQHYFVRRQCAPTVCGFRFDGIERARPQAQFLALLEDPNLAAVVICPSNPFVSVRPILALAGVEQALRKSQAPVIAVSPIVAGTALKGPAAKMMAELGMPASALAVARYYGALLDGFVIDTADAAQAGAIRALGVEVLAVPTVMQTLQDRIDLARAVLAFSGQKKPRL